MSKRAQQKQQRYQSIIATAKELFLERGVENIQMQDIATAAEIGIATLFRYFPKKEIDHYTNRGGVFNTFIIRCLQVFLSFVSRWRTIAWDRSDSLEI